MSATKPDRWRLGHKPGDWLRALNCRLSGHRWHITASKTQRLCLRCYLVEDRGDHLVSRMLEAKRAGHRWDWDDDGWGGVR